MKPQKNTLGQIRLLSEINPESKIIEELGSIFLDTRRGMLIYLYQANMGERPTNEIWEYFRSLDSQELNEEINNYSDPTSLNEIGNSKRLFETWRIVVLVLGIFLEAMGLVLIEGSKKKK